VADDSQSAELLAMVEILLSLLLLIAAVSFTLWPLVAAHDRTVDGLFVTLTGTMLTLLFLFNFIWQLRSQGNKELTAIKNVWQKCIQAFRLTSQKGDADMKIVPSRISIPLAMGIVLLLILSFPGSLYASDSPAQPAASLRSAHQHLVTTSLAHHLPGAKRVCQHSGLLMDADMRLRAAAALSSNPAIERAARTLRVPLRMVVITASPLLEV
jgi:hypothetical protein